ncbi:15311_t:CDS:1, partial [Cetraspora pellucida]
VLGNVSRYSISLVVMNIPENFDRSNIIITSNQNVNNYKNYPSEFKVCNENEFINTFKMTMNWIPSRYSLHKPTIEIDNNEIDRVMKFSCQNNKSLLDKKRNLFGKNDKDPIVVLEEKVDKIVDEEIDKYKRFNLRRRPTIDLCEIDGESDGTLIDELINDNDEYTPIEEPKLKPKCQRKRRKNTKKPIKKLTKKQKIQRELKDLLQNSEDFLKPKNLENQEVDDTNENDEFDITITEVQDETIDKDDKNIIGKRIILKNIKELEYKGLKLHDIGELEIIEL